MGLMLRGTAEICVSSTCTHCRGTGFLAKCIEMDCVLLLYMKYVHAARWISDFFVHKGVLKSFSAETHQRAEGYQAAELVFYDRSRF